MLLIGHVWIPMDGAQCVIYRMIFAVRCAVLNVRLSIGHSMQIC